MKWNIELNVEEKRERKSATILQILPLMTTLEESWSRLQSGVDQWMETDRDKMKDSEVMFGDFDSFYSYKYYKNIDSLNQEDPEDCRSKKKTTEDVQEDKKPLAGKLTDQGDAGNIRKMRDENEIKLRDALQTPSRVRDMETKIKNYSSPSLKHVKVTRQG